MNNYEVKDHYKTIYQVLEQRVVIIQVFDTRQDPSKMGNPCKRRYLKLAEENLVSFFNELPIL